ncbi:MAG: hypothetical protein IKH76_06700, partial [Clostridiales bacterium]|nr:hypothetical protein [Clostridiales bacterium]
MILTINRSIVSTTLRISNAVISITSFLPEWDWRVAAYRLEVAPQDNMVSRKRERYKLTLLMLDDRIAYKTRRY